MNKLRKSLLMAICMAGPSLLAQDFSYRRPGRNLYQEDLEYFSLER
jgi:hypothetical protein